MSPCVFLFCLKVTVQQECREPFHFPLSIPACSKMIRSGDAKIAEKMVRACNLFPFFGGNGWI